MPEKKQYTRQEVEDFFTRQFKGHIISFSYPRYDTIYGMCHEVAFDERNGGELILHINDTRYTCSLESVNECVKLIRE